MPAATPRPPRMIATGAELARRCRDWRELPALGLDTEFVRERTYYPLLGLIQVGDGETDWLVDPVAIKDLEPLAEILRDPAIETVWHSCSEDMEVLYHRFEAFPRPVFDTQIAAAFTGLGYSLGYGPLVERVFGVELPKGETRSNWLRRPLTDAQKVYAGLDVAYLLPLHRELSAKLRALGREGWAREEFERLADARRFLPDPDGIYRQLARGRNLPRRELAVLRALAAWREREARRRDLPRNFVLRRHALLPLARRRPRSRKDLAKIRELHPRERERHGRTLLRLVREALELPDDELPPAQARVERPSRRTVARLRDEVAAIARELDLPAELLATRKTVESLVRRAEAGKTPVLPRRLRGWREAVVGERLLAVLDELGATP